MNIRVEPIRQRGELPPFGHEWQKYVEVGSRIKRATDFDALIGDPSKAETELNWKAKVKWKQLAHIMVDAELKGV